MFNAFRPSSIIRFSLSIAATTAVILVLNGCANRLPGGGPGEGELDLQSFQSSSTSRDDSDYGTEMEPLDSEITPWTSTDDPIPDEQDEQSADNQERRWEGVAIYFAYDRSTIGEAERPKLETLADFLDQNSNYEVIIEGHADSRGSDEYNRGLSERRALAVKEYLIDLGVEAERLQTIAYGEDKPAVPDATSESQHARNRRVEFVFLIPR
ncbi:MAG: OmpA family protein [Verrucomicrobiota bacterium]